MLNKIARIKNTKPYENLSSDIHSLIEDLDQIKESAQDMVNHTDLYPWYWIAYGDKCYAFAVVEAYPKMEGQLYPTPGSKLEMHESEPLMWVGDNGVNMVIESYIADIQNQNGDTICSFIAKTHALHLKDFLPKE